MKSELTTVQPKPNGFPKLMRRKDHSMVIIATDQTNNSLTGTVVWVQKGCPSELGNYSKHWDAISFIDLPSSECVIISNG